VVSLLSSMAVARIIQGNAGGLNRRNHRVRWFVVISIFILLRPIK
jgi:hypothetical protein